MVIPYFTGSLDERMKRLRSALFQETGIILVGSSFGGLMAAIFAMENEERVERMILLAPAINLVEFADYRSKTLSVPVWIYHGSADEVIPLNEVEKVAKSVFHHLSFHVVEEITTFLRPIRPWTGTGFCLRANQLSELIGLKGLRPHLLRPHGGAPPNLQD